MTRNDDIKWNTKPGLFNFSAKPKNKTMYIGLGLAEKELKAHMIYVE
jgi:hypothetical protein